MWRPSPPGQKGGISQWQAEKRRDNRFNAMLFDWYGGRKAIRHVIKTGRLVQIRLRQTHRNLEFRSSVKSDTITIIPLTDHHTLTHPRSNSGVPVAAPHFPDVTPSHPSQQTLEKKRRFPPHPHHPTSHPGHPPTPPKQGKGEEGEEERQGGRER